MCAFQRAEAVAFELERTKERKRRSVPDPTSRALCLRLSVSRYSARNGLLRSAAVRDGLDWIRPEAPFGHGARAGSCLLRTGLSSRAGGNGGCG